MTDQQKTNGETEQHSNGIPLLEWAVAAVGFVIVVGTIVYLLSLAIAGDKAPPSFALTVTEIVESSGGYLVKFSIVNEGGSTAAGLLVEGSLLQDGEVVETSEAEIDYVPSASSRYGGIFFTENPDSYDLELRPVGFHTP